MPFWAWVVFFAVSCLVSYQLGRQSEITKRAKASKTDESFRSRKEATENIFKSLYDHCLHLSKCDRTWQLMVTRQLNNDLGIISFNDELLPHGGRLQLHDEEIFRITIPLKGMSIKFPIMLNFRVQGGSPIRDTVGYGDSKGEQDRLIEDCKTLMNRYATHLVESPVTK